MHKCIRCGKIYDDNDPSVLRGCSVCGSVFFLYIRDREQEKIVEDVERKLREKKTSLEEEVKKKVEEKKRERRKKFGIETVMIKEEGIYEINLDALMRGRPLIVLEKGKVYFVHLPSIFEKNKI